MRTVGIGAADDPCVPVFRSQGSPRFRKSRFQITPNLLRKKIQASIDYFESTPLDLDSVWTRKPEKETANLSTVITNKESWSSMRSEKSPFPYLRPAQLIRSNLWPNIIHELTTTDSTTPVHIAYAYLAAFFSGDEQLAGRAAQYCLTTPINTADIPHFYHLIDECQHIRTGPCLECLMGLMGIERYSRAKTVSQTYALPTFGKHNVKRPRWIEYQNASVLARLVRGGDEKLPMLVPVCEGFSIVELKQGVMDRTVKAVVKLIANGMYEQAVTKATQLLGLGKNEADLLFHRAVALMMLHKDTDALVDVERSLMLEDSKQTAIHLRSALLMRLNLKTAPSLTGSSQMDHDSVMLAQRMMMGIPDGKPSFPFKWSSVFAKGAGL